jgi:hypothetical protein
MRSYLPSALLVAALLAAAVALPAAAQDPAPKRSEGTYFIELAEIMLNTEDFDILFLEDDEAGPRAGAAPTGVTAELPSNHLEAPTFTLGLNRPSGKSAISVSFQDFDLGSERIPSDFDREGYVSTSYLQPPGVAFQRQARPLRRFGTSLDDDYYPNWGTDWAYRLQVEEQVSNLTYEHNAFENEKFRLRWIGGITYGKLQQDFAHAMAFAQEYGPADGGFGGGGGANREEQDFLLVMANVSTSGIGPKLGLDGRWLIDKKKKWSVEARAEIAFLPETTSANYDLNMVDASPELVIRRIMAGDTVSISIMPANEPPVAPGLPAEALIDYGQPFAATINQQDFTEMVMLATGRVGFRYQATSHISVGLDVWQQRWMNVLSNTAMLATINSEATFDYIPAQLGPSGGLNPDPQLQFDQAIVNVPRLTGRQDFVFDGINLNLSFQF